MGGVQVSRLWLCSSVAGMCISIFMAGAVRDPLWLVIAMTFAADSTRALGEMERA